MSTRRPPPMEVYQDPDASFTSRNEHDVEAALLNALRPLGDASNKANISLNPTTEAADGLSPHKSDSSPMQPMSSHLPHLKIPPPQQPDFVTHSPRKNNEFYHIYHDAASMPSQPLFHSVPATHAHDKENASFDTSAFDELAHVPYPDSEYVYKGPMKRGLGDPSISGKDRGNAKRQRVEDDEPFDLPDPNDMPAVVDDGLKPSHSYATLIGMAILRAPQRRLTLAQIYKWISDNYSFYRISEAGWQNSIRHNLSLNKNFIKQERPKDDPGKGNYWAIKPGQEKTYLIDKKNPLRRLASSDGAHYVAGFPSDINGFRPATAPAIGQFSLAPNPSRKMDAKAVDSAKFPDDAELLSDGTIVASDSGLHDEEHVVATSIMPPPPAPMRSSPPPQEFGSSPPAMLPPQPQRKGTPPPAPRFPTESRSGGRKRKSAALHDSGYWSSIESSAARGAAHQLTSEADIARPHIKKGRAEEEIARIRSSSFDSPSKAHRRGSSVHFSTSSPVHQSNDNPLTPALVFKRPAKPPPSVSPNTNLKNHRDRIKALLGSPAKAFSPMPEANTWSPAFNIAEDGHVGLTPFISPFKTAKTPWRILSDTPVIGNTQTFNTTFDVFIDAPEDDLASRGSPEKRSVKRPSLIRAATSAGILADVTGTSKANATLTPTVESSPFSISPFLVKPSLLRSPSKLGSPLKQVQRPSPPGPSNDLSWLSVDGVVENVQPSDLMAKKDASELFGVQLPSDGSEEGIDIFQDFGKIGQTQALPAVDRGTGSPVRRAMGPPARPFLNRSHTSRW